MPLQSGVHSMAGEVAVVRVADLEVSFPLEGSRNRIRAVNHISFDLHRAETLSLVGESGCGKTTTGRSIAGLCPITGGAIEVDNDVVSNYRGRWPMMLRRKVQMIFQDPYSSLDPRTKVGRTIEEGLKIHGLVTGRRGRRVRVLELLDLVELPHSMIERYPRELSGGQRQRVNIARALAVEPSVLVCDEIVSALDVRVQARILDLLVTLQGTMGLSYLFMSHDLGVVQGLSHRVAVMYLGEIVELAATQTVFEEPRHPYTACLMSAHPLPDPDLERARRRVVTKGDLPDPSSPPVGCRFHPRCPLAREHCQDVRPDLRTVGRRHLAACHYSEETTSLV